MRILKSATKIYKLWLVWKYAFEDAGFNKCHGLLCTTRNCIHKYSMAGSVSNESNKYFNNVLADIKRLLKNMSQMTGRVRMINDRAQSNLKEKVLQPRVEIAEKVARNKRGPKVWRETLLQRPPRKHDGVEEGEWRIFTLIISATNCMFLILVIYFCA